MLATSIPQGSKHLVIASLLVDLAISDGIWCDRTRLNEAIGIQTFSWGPVHVVKRRLPGD